MIDAMVLEVLKQGAFACLAGIMFVVYRKDSKDWAAKQSETAAAFMGFGERTATALTQVSETLRMQTAVMERIERHLNDNHLCPVTQVTSQALREAVELDVSKRRIEAVVKDAIQRVADGKAQQAHAAR